MDVRQRMGVDWTVLATAVKNKDAKVVAEYIRDALSHRRVNYREVQRTLEEFCLSQVSCIERLEFIIHTVPLVKTSSQHMLLELLTPTCVESASQEHRQEAVQLFWKLLNGSQESATTPTRQSQPGESAQTQRPKASRNPDVQGARAAVKLFMVFNMTVDEVGGLDRIRNDFVEPLLRLSRQQKGQGRALQPVLSLACKDPKVLQGFETAGFLSAAVEQGQTALASDVVQQLPHKEQKAFVTELSDRKNLKAAANAVRTLQLQDDFPDTESQYRDSVVKQLLGRGRWSMAAEWVTDDPKQQMQVVEAIATAGEIAMAREYAEGFFGSSTVPGLDLSDEALRAAADSMETVFVNSFEQLPEMQKVLEASTCLTLDVEWRPLSFTPRGSSSVAPAAVNGLSESSPRPSAKDNNGHLLQTSEGREKKPLDDSSKPTSPAATLQIAVDDIPLGWQGTDTQKQEDTEGSLEKRASAVKVFVIDLLELGGSSELDAALAGVMQSSAIPKIGLVLTGDLSKLLRSYPSMISFQKVLAILDLQTVWQKANQRMENPRKTAGSQIGLSSLSSVLLGKPLDKSMQVSDWSKRPLSASQVHYAALDAAVQVHLLQSLCSLGKLSPSDLIAMCSDWPSSNPKKQRISQDPHSITPQGHNGDEDPPPPGAGGSGGGGSSVGGDSAGLRGPSDAAGTGNIPEGGAACSMNGNNGVQQAGSATMGNTYSSTGTSARSHGHPLCSPQQDGFRNRRLAERGNFDGYDYGVTMMRSVSGTASGFHSCAPFPCPAAATHDARFAVPYCTIPWCAATLSVDDCLNS